VRTIPVATTAIIPVGDVVSDASRATIRAGLDDALERWVTRPRTPEDVACALCVEREVCIAPSSAVLTHDV